MSSQNRALRNLHFVFTVCDTAAKQVCPVWSGQPMTAHWGVRDPAAVIGSEEQVDRAFRDAFNLLDRRISLLLCLPFASLDKLAIQKEIDRIGKEIPEVKANAWAIPVLRAESLSYLAQNRIARIWARARLEKIRGIMSARRKA